MPMPLLFPVLGPAAVDQFDDRIVHDQRRWVAFLPCCIDTDLPAIQRPRAHECLLGKEHVPRWIEPSEDTPLEVFVIVQTNIRTHCNDEPNTQRRLDEILDDFSRVLSYDHNE